MLRLFVGGPYDGVWKDVDELVGTEGQQVTLLRPGDSVDRRRHAEICIYHKLRFFFAETYRGESETWMDVWMWSGVVFHRGKAAQEAFIKSIGMD